MPDFKTIANFRKDNGKAIRQVTMANRNSDAIGDRSRGSAGTARLADAETASSS
jgi:hypothetical protein